MEDKIHFSAQQKEPLNKQNPLTRYSITPDICISLKAFLAPQRPNTEFLFINPLSNNL